MMQSYESFSQYFGHIRRLGLVELAGSIPWTCGTGVSVSRMSHSFTTIGLA